MPEKDVTPLAWKIELLLMDVDGVLTDGRLLLIPMPDGSVVEAKAFSVNDGAALAMARRAGLKTGIISGRSSPALTRRAVRAPGSRSGSSRSVSLVRPSAISSPPPDAVRKTLTGYQNPVPLDVLQFQIGLAAKEASDGEFVPEQFRAMR